LIDITGSATTALDTKYNELESNTSLRI